MPVLSSAPGRHLDAPMSSDLFPRRWGCRSPPDGITNDLKRDVCGRYGAIRDIADTADAAGALDSRSMRRPTPHLSARVEQETPSNRPMVVREVKGIVNIGGAEVGAVLITYRHLSTLARVSFVCPAERSRFSLVRRESWARIFCRERTLVISLDYDGIEFHSVGNEKNSKVRPDDSC